MSLFIFSQFKFSDNNIINLLQKIVIYTFIFIFNFLLMFIIGWYFNLIPTAICSPDEFIANSVLEKGELLFNGDSPLETILTSLLSLNVLILFTNILFLYFIFSRYIFKHNITFILYLCDKILSNKFKNMLSSKLNVSVDYHNKTMFFFIYI